MGTSFAKIELWDTLETGWKGMLMNRFWSFFGLSEAVGRVPILYVIFFINAALIVGGAGGPPTLRPDTWAGKCSN